MQTTQQLLQQIKGRHVALCKNCKTQVRRTGVEEKEIKPNLYEIGESCPNCQHWYHWYFLNDDLRDNKPDNSRKSKREYKKRFDRFNKKVRGHLGMRKVNGQWQKRDVSS